VPFDNITQGETVTAPGEGAIEIVGINEEFLFISRRRDTGNTRNFDTYRISLATWDATRVDSGEYDCVPLFHAPSNSLLFAHGCQDESLVRLEVLSLDSDARRFIYEFTTENFHSPEMGWRLLENNAVLFTNSAWGASEWGSDFILIDADFVAQAVQLDEIEIRQPIADMYVSFVPQGDWTYFINRMANWDMYGRLYRERENEVVRLQDDIDFVELFGVNDILFATMFPRPHQGEDSLWCEVVVLSKYGEITKVLGGGWHGHNSALGVQRLAGTDIVMVTHFSFFRIHGWVQSLYCTTTGALFQI
jgi:hypothetical protein